MQLQVPLIGSEQYRLTNNGRAMSAYMRSNLGNRHHHMYQLGMSHRQFCYIDPVSIFKAPPGMSGAATAPAASHAAPEPSRGPASATKLTVLP